MVKEIIANNEERLEKSIAALKREFGSLRAGRATPSLLDKVMVDYYGTPTPVNQVAKVSVPEPRMLIAFLENHLQADGTVTIPAVLQPYMGGKTVLVPKKK